MFLGQSPEIDWDMSFKRKRLLSIMNVLALALLLAGLPACASSDDDPYWSVSGTDPTAEALFQQTPTVWGLLARRTPGGPLLTPTPDSPHDLPFVRKDPEQYQIQAGDTLGQIANRYGVSLEQLVEANLITDPNRVEVGQVLVIPVPTPLGPGSSFKIIPDSELVYGPASIGFDVQAVVAQAGGYLTSYREQVEEQNLTGAQVVERVARDYSVNPRLLLAVLEHMSGWLIKAAPEKTDYPLGFPDPNRKGLFRQLSWAANNLNRGYYLWRVDGIGAWLMADSSITPISPTINAGTAAVQQLFALLSNRSGWDKAVSENGLFATYSALFGFPFDYSIEPNLPARLTQPPMQLPFEPEVRWAFTSGPHAAWGDGSAWAALDFAPPIEAVGCVDSSEWVTTVADGLILRSENGVVIQDLDADGYEQTGWVVLYLHIATRDRILPGAFLQAGERIGHPSCEGGVSTGTHLHLARRFNGEWISADQGLPFALDGWVSSSAGKEYDGYMQRSGQKIEAYAGISGSNWIQR